ncbi:hypothetical protein PSI23_08600 [Xenorhabdus sp. XENO-10]|uniref:Uncharacterized protein n=1 Tax=Xenorhabdus yunnanensis TaxID=3025878 RepID=A0ABT5LHN9_9GAMM|nr:hypothetical protein [Xenorhabdus yunnanensis]MDC9589379.1 hypothetical protein [Xenorhabdus yunnanensis]
MGFFDQIANMLSGGKNQQFQHMMDWVEDQGGIRPNGEVPGNLDLKSAGIDLLKNKLLGK